MTTYHIEIHRLHERSIMDSFKPINNPKITAQIAQQIRQAILNGELKQSDKLPSERVLVDRFGASRIAVREALKSLEACGLVVSRHGSGVFVAETNTKTMSDSLYSILRIRNASLDEVTEARLIFEPHVARLAAERITEEDIVLLEDNIRRTAEVLKGKIPAGTLNIEFHALIAESVHNVVIDLTMKSLLEVSRVMTEETSVNVRKRYATSMQAQRQHVKIMQALIRKDPDDAYELMRTHIMEVQVNLKNAIFGE